MAREPDKLSFSKIFWDDPELLMRVLDERLATSQPGSGSAEDIWRRYFVPTVGTTPVREYIVSRTLPRPRDILYLARAAVATAINRRHTKVLESDIQEAEKQYSQYALDTIETEATAAFPDLGNLLYEFVGATEILERDNLERFMNKVGFVDQRAEEAIEFLLSFGFLGLEVRDGHFGFANDENELKKNSVLSRKLREETGRAPRYSIHRSFHSYLEIQKGVAQATLFGRQNS